MKAETVSRGKKQRIVKRILKLTGGTVEIGDKPQRTKDDAKKRVEQLMKKRDQKAKVKVPHVQPEDKAIIKQAKNTKREKRRTKTAEEDEFDAALKTYQSKLLKRLKKDEPKGAPFEEVVMSD